MLHDSIRQFLSTSSSSSSAILVRGFLQLLLSSPVSSPEKLTVTATVRWPSEIYANLNHLALCDKPEEKMAVMLFSSGYDGTDEDEEMRRERRRRRRQKVSSCCKQMAAFLFSHIGLAAMVVAYSIMGGFMFRAIEAPAESRVKLEIVQAREEKIEGIWKLAVELQRRSYGKLLENTNGSTKDNFTSSVRVIMIDFKDEVVDAVKSMGWDGQEDMDETKLQWSFAGALLYAVTVITTIGYGHVAPKTDWGRILTMIYALIGIPLTFLYLSNIGNFMANCFRMFYKRVCCDILCCEKCNRARRRERLKQRRQRELAVQRNILLGLHPGIIGCNGADEPTADHISNPETPTTATTFIPEPTYETFDDDDTTATAIFNTNNDGNISPTANTERLGDETKSDLNKRDSAPTVSLTTFGDISTFMIPPYTSQSSSLKSTGSRQSSLSTLPAYSRRSSITSVRETAILDDDNPSSRRNSLDGQLDVTQTDGVSGNTSLLLVPPSCSNLNHSGSNRSARLNFRLDNLENQRETDILCESSVGCDSSTDGEHIPTPQTIRRFKPDIENAPILRKNGIMIQLQQPQSMQHPANVLAESDAESARYDRIIDAVDHPSARRAKSYSLRHVTGEGRRTVASLADRPEVSSSSPVILRSSLHKHGRISHKDGDDTSSEVDGHVTIQSRVGNHAMLGPDAGKVSSRSPSRLKTKTAGMGNERGRASISGQRVSLSTSRHAILPPIPSGISGADGVDRHLRARSNWAKLRNHYHQQHEQENKPKKRPPTTTSGDGPFYHRPEATKSRVSSADKRRISMNEGTLSAPLPRTYTHSAEVDEDDRLQPSALSTDMTNTSGHHSVSFHDALPHTDASAQHRKPTKATVDRTTSAPPRIGIDADTGRRLEMTSSLRDKARGNGQRGGSGGGFDDETFVDSTSTLCNYNATRTTSNRTGSSEETVKIRPGDVDEDLPDRSFNPFIASLEDEMERTTYGGRDYDPFEYEHVSTEHEGKVTVPIAICLVIIAGYIFAGAVLFTLWEDWDYLTGSYFCFITLSTIGFGDIVPGTDMDKWASHEKLVLCALWLAFGLSLLAMCFNLMQEEVKEKCKWIGLRLGLLHDDEQQ